MSQLPEIEEECVAIRERLDVLLPELEELRERRQDLWQQARDQGAPSIEIARWSGVRGPTIRKSTTKGTS